MDRSIDSDPRETDMRTPAREPERQAGAPERTREDNAKLRDQIDSVTRDQPTFSQFVERLEQLGIRAIPSLQKSGRLNGMSYEVTGTRIKGSDLGRRYSARGLEKSKGLVYDVERDHALAKQLVERARPNILPPERSQQIQARRAERARERGMLSPRQHAVMRDVGRFRTIMVNDLVRIQHGGNWDAWQRDVKPLVRQGLAEVRSVVITTHAKNERPVTRSVSVIVLTKQGRDLLKRIDPDLRNRGQALYAGFVKPREIAHDAAIYRMYQAEEAYIREQGGRVKRIVLDYELKKKAYAPLARARQVSLEEYKRKQAEIAQENGLKVIDGKIRLPDLRIEYETANGDAARVDLELATEHYRGEHMSTKSQAGFKIYAERASFPPGGGSGGSPVWDDHAIEIFSF